MNRCLSFAWLGCVGIGGITREGRREKIPEAQSLYRIVYEASSCMTSALAGALAGSEQTCVCCSDGFGRGGGRRCHDFKTGDLSRAPRGKPVRWDKLWYVALQGAERRAVLRRTRLFGSSPC